MREKTNCSATTLYRLCKEFHWTPDIIHKQNARDMDMLITVIQEMDSLQSILNKVNPGDNETLIVIDSD